MIGKLAQFRFRLRSLFLLITVCAVLLGVWARWEYLPGTYYRDSDGFPHGTGTTEYNYDASQLMLKEWYRGGLIYRATWYRPDGTEVATAEYDKKAGGVGYYLRQDGSIKSKYSYTYSPTDHVYFADGPATFFRVDGIVEKIVNYENGVAVKP